MGCVATHLLLAGRHGARVDDPAAPRSTRRLLFVFGARGGSDWTDTGRRPGGVSGVSRLGIVDAANGSACATLVADAVHHNRLRRVFGLSFADRIGHDVEAA